MGHKVTRTTKLYYARRKNSAAIDKARNVWCDSDPKKLTAERQHAGMAKWCSRRDSDPSPGLERAG